MGIDFALAVRVSEPFDSAYQRPRIDSAAALHTTEEDATALNIRRPSRF
jgi:hypothetical protein